MGGFHIMPFINLLDTGQISSVQSGNFILDDLDTSDTVTITSVVKNKSFLMYTYRGDGGALDASEIWVRGQITNGTTLTFNRHAAPGGGDDFTIYWFVVEFTASSSVTVEHGTETLGAATDNVTISSINQANAFPIITWSLNEGNPGIRAFVKGQLTSTTNLQLSVTSLATQIVDWQVIENLDWDVTEYTDTMAAIDTVEDVTITAIILAETMLVGNGRPASGSGTITGDEIPRFNYTSTTNIQAVRNAAGYEFDFVYYVVETNGLVSCIHDITETIANGQTLGTTAIAAINTALSALKFQSVTTYMATNNSGTGRALGRVAVNLEINSSTEIGQERESTQDEVAVAFDVWDFT